MLNGTKQEPAPGIQLWKNKNGFAVLWIHYTADPEKSEEWAAKVSTKYPGGKEGKGWQAEMEIDFMARTGGRVWPEFNRATHVYDPTIVFKEWGGQPPPHWPRFRTIDPGLHNPTACLWVAIDGDDAFWVYREHYQSGWSIPQHAQAIRGGTGRDRIEFTVIDPSASASTLANQNSIAEQFAQEGIFCTPGDNRVSDGLTAVAEAMRIADYGEPRIKVSNDCPNTINEILGYRWRTLTDVLAQRRGVYEEPVKKDDHTCDALRYLVMACPQGYMQSRGVSDPGYQPKMGLSDKIWQHIQKNREAGAV